MIKYFKLLFPILFALKILARELETFWPKQIEVNDIIITEAGTRDDPVNPVILKNREAAPEALFADENGNLYWQDEDGNRYEKNGSSWVRTDNKIDA